MLRASNLEFYIILFRISIFEFRASNAEHWFKSDVKFRCSTPEPHRILAGLRKGGADGTHGVGVKSVDIVRNTRGEGGQLALF